MKPSEAPLKVLLSKLMTNLKHQQDFYKSFSRDDFLDELHFIRTKRQLELPANWVTKYYKKGVFEKVQCAGFGLSNCYPNNIAVFRDPESSFGLGVIWVTSIHFDSGQKRTATVIGHKFEEVSSVL